MNESPIPANADIVEIDFPASEFRPLNQHKIPMDGGGVAVIGIVVTLSGGKVQTAVNLFIEQGISHGFFNEGVDPDGELPDVAGAVICIEDVIDFFCIVGGGADDFAILEFQNDGFVSKSLVDSRCVIRDCAINRGFDGSGIDLAVGKVHGAVALDGADAFDREGEIGAWAQETDFVCGFHQGAQGIHGGGQLGVVHGADLKIKVGEGFCAHLSQLCHGRVGITQDAPFAVFDSLLHMNRQRVEVGVDLHIGGRNIGEFIDIGAGADADISLDIAHLGEVPAGHGPGLIFGQVQEKFPLQVAEGNVVIGEPAHPVGFFDEGAGQPGVSAGIVNENTFAGLQRDRI